MKINVVPVLSVEASHASSCSYNPALQPGEQDWASLLQDEICEAETSFSPQSSELTQTSANPAASHRYMSKSSQDQCNHLADPQSHEQ